VNSRDFTIRITLLAGKTRAIQENAEKWPLKQIAQEFRNARDLFEELVFILKADPGIPVEQHVPSLSTISYDLAAASYILTKRVSKKDALKQQIRAVCRAIDDATKKMIGVALLGPIFDFFVRSREISEEAEALLQISDVRPPHLLQEQTVRQRVASAAPYVRPHQPSKAPPAVPKQYRIERVGDPPHVAVSSKAPPPVPPKYRVEHVGVAKRTREGSR
jgi:hypothetical protein